MLIILAETDSQHPYQMIPSLAASKYVLESFADLDPEFQKTMSTPNSSWSQGDMLVLHISKN